MNKKELVAEVMDRWTDTFYSDVRELLEIYSTEEYSLKELDELTEEVIYEMIKFYAENNSHYNNYVNNKNTVLTKNYLLLILNVFQNYYNDFVNISDDDLDNMYKEIAKEDIKQMTAKKLINTYIKNL